LIILLSATLSLFLANLLRIPQSTSQVTIGALVGAGLYFKQLYLKTLFLKLLPFWLVLPGLAYLVTFLVYRKIYPPERGNLYLYEKIFAREDKLRRLSLVSSCYVAFAIGSNNVANIVGPLTGAGLINLTLGLLIVAPLFGIGAGLLGKGPLETVGKEIVCLGLISSTLVSFVTATLLIVASLLGIPQSLVQLNLSSIFAVGCLKNGHKDTLVKRVTLKTFFIWLVTPLLAMLLAYFLLLLFRSINVKIK
jgi:sulfate permease